MRRISAALSFILVIFLAACGGEGDTSSGSVDQATLNLGKTVFQANCSACHSTAENTILVGPSLHNIADWGGDMVEGMNAYQYIEQSILAPDAFVTEGFQDVMPKTFPSTLTAKQIDAVIQYLLHQG